MREGVGDALPPPSPPISLLLIPNTILVLLHFRFSGRRRGRTLHCPPSAGAELNVAAIDDQFKCKIKGFETRLLTVSLGCVPVGLGIALLLKVARVLVSYTLPSPSPSPPSRL